MGYREQEVKNGERNGSEGKEMVKRKMRAKKEKYIENVLKREQKEELVKRWGKRRLGS